MEDRKGGRSTGRGFTGSVVKVRTEQETERDRGNKERELIMMKRSGLE